MASLFIFLRVTGQTGSKGFYSAGGPAVGSEAFDAGVIIIKSNQQVG